MNVSKTAEVANSLVLKHEYIGLTLFKVGVALSAVSAAGWAVFSFLAQ